MNENLPAEQYTSIYWSENMSRTLETWGEKHVWNEIQMLLCCVKGKVLDIACGTGVAIKILSKYDDLDLYGCDISDFLISKARNKGINNLKLKVCNAINMSCYESNYFDHSYSIGSLEHFTIEGIIKFISEAYRVTKNNSFHMIPVSKNKKENGWIKTNQCYFNNSEDWWIEKFKSKYKKVYVVSSGWEDQISTGKWFVCNK